MQLDTLLFCCGCFSNPLKHTNCKRPSPLEDESSNAAFRHAQRTPPPSGAGRAVLSYGNFTVFQMRALGQRDLDLSPVTVHGAGAGPESGSPVSAPMNSLQNIFPRARAVKQHSLRGRSSMFRKGLPPHQEVLKHDRGLSAPPLSQGTWSLSGTTRSAAEGPSPPLQMTHC